MSKDKIDVKEVPVQQFNPKTHKGSADRFNPSNRIYVRAVKGFYQRMRRYMGWVFMLFLSSLPGFPTVTGRQSCWILAANGSIFLALRSGHRI